jgi:O-antigen/teichoic acid export membrane protein
LIVFGKPIISLTYGEEFLPTYPALAILLLGFTFVNIFYWNRVALISLGRAVYPTLVNFAGMLLKVGAIFLLVPSTGWVFAALLVGYYLFTVGGAVGRVLLDVRDSTQALETA